MSLLEKKDLVKYPTPMQAGRISHLLVNWSRRHRVNPDPKAVTLQLYRAVSGPARRYVDNTLEFLDWLAKKRPKSEKPEHIR